MLLTDIRLSPSVYPEFHLSNVKAIQKINEAELQSGTKKSWHGMYSHSAYIFIGKRYSHGQIMIRVVKLQSSEN